MDNIDHRLAAVLHSIVGQSVVIENQAQFKMHLAQLFNTVQSAKAIALWPLLRIPGIGAELSVGLRNVTKLIYSALFVHGVHLGLHHFRDVLVLVPVLPCWWLHRSQRPRRGQAVGLHTKSSRVVRAHFGEPLVLLVDIQSEALSLLPVDDLARVSNEIRGTGTSVPMIEQQLDLVRCYIRGLIVMAKSEINDRGLTLNIDSDQHLAMLAF